MLYFTTRLYPKRKNILDLKKMEEAFIKGLRHILSKQYKYVIVADRGFGNERFARFCEENNFEYVLRVASNRKIKIDGEKEVKKLQDFDQQNHRNLKCFVEAWEKTVTFEISTREDSTWFLLNGTENLNAVELYEKRFKIEKLFQDIKSSGFDIEKTKIRKYDRFRRLLYCVVIAHMFVVVLGNFLETQKNNIKKNSALHIETLLAFLNWDLDRFPHSLINPLKSFVEFG
jgi:transposase